MATVAKVIAPPFYCEKEPYIIVFFVEETENKFKIAALSTPRYFTIYDVRKLYPELTAYEAKNLFIKEMYIGRREEINLHEFTISKLTAGKHLSVRSSVYVNETYFRVAVYDEYDEYKTAKKILAFCINYHLLGWND